MALAIDKEDRPETALLLGEAITSGARGVEPNPNGARAQTLGGTAATRVLGHGAPTAQTRVDAAHTAAHQPDGCPLASQAARAPPGRLSPADVRLRSRRAVTGTRRSARAALEPRAGSSPSSP